LISASKWSSILKHFTHIFSSLSPKFWSKNWVQILSNTLTPYFQCCVVWWLMFTKKFVINYLNCLPNGVLNNVNWSMFLSLTECLIWGPRKILFLTLELVMWQFLLQKFKCFFIMVHSLTKFIIVLSFINIKGKNISLDVVVSHDWCSFVTLPHLHKSNRVW
jgi:hypothetical protein